MIRCEVSDIKAAFDQSATAFQEKYRVLLEDPDNRKALMLAGYAAGRCGALGMTLAQGPGECRRANMATTMLCRLFEFQGANPEEPTD